MKRLILTGLALLLLSGCADLQMIKTAAMSELQSEAISVEMAAYRQTTPSPIAVEVEQPALTKRQAEGLMVLAMGPGTMATPKYPKGRWER